MNLFTCFNIDRYRDALCKIGNEMHSNYRYSQLSSCTHRQYEQQLNSLSNEDSCLLTMTLTRGPDGDCTRMGNYWIGIGVSLRNKRTVK